MRRAVREMGQTIVMVTHDPVAAGYADRVLFLADGRIVDEMADPTAERVLDRMKRFGDVDRHVRQGRPAGGARPGATSRRPAISDVPGRRPRRGLRRRHARPHRHDTRRSTTCSPRLRGHRRGRALGPDVDDGLRRRRGPRADSTPPARRRARRRRRRRGRQARSQGYARIIDKDGDPSATRPWARPTFGGNWHRRRRSSTRSRSPRAGAPAGRRRDRHRRGQRRGRRLRGRRPVPVLTQRRRQRLHARRHRPVRQRRQPRRRHARAVRPPRPRSGCSASPASSTIIGVGGRRRRVQTELVARSRAAALPAASRCSPARRSPRRARPTS